MLGCKPKTKSVIAKPLVRATESVVARFLIADGLCVQPDKSQHVSSRRVGSSLSEAESRSRVPGVPGDANPLRPADDPPHLAIVPIVALA